MPNATTPIEDRPAICEAIDYALAEAARADPGLTNQFIAQALGVSGAAVGRWRTTIEPTRDQQAALEHAIHKPLGYCSRLAGYVADEPTDKPRLERALDMDTRISDTYREIVRAVIVQAIAGTKSE